MVHTGEFSGTSRQSALSPVFVFLAKTRDAAGVGRILAGEETAIGQRAFQVVVADVVGAPLEQRDLDRRLVPRAPSECPG